MEVKLLMQLTESEKQQIDRILNKTKQINGIDPEYKIFGSKTWKYKWPKQASEKKLVAFEKEHDITLPREYRLFLGCVANGGPGFAYGLYPIQKTEMLGDIHKDCTCFPSMTYEDFEALDARQQAIYEADANSEEDLFYNGLLTIGTEGCTYDTCLVVTGKYRGRLVSTDGNEEGPFRFIHDENFLDWYERWLDDFIAGLEMGNFGVSVPGSQPELRTQFLNQEDNLIKANILSSLGRFPQIDPETTALWEYSCKTEPATEICEVALRQLIRKQAPSIPDILRLLLDSSDLKRNICIRVLRLASANNVNIEPLIPKLLEIMPTLSEDLFSNAVWAVQKTSYNKYEAFLPFLELSDTSKKITSIWALENSPDKNPTTFVNHMLPFFNEADIDLVRQVILSLIEIQDNRVPPMVDSAYQKFSEFETLRKNYYQRTWGKTIVD